MTVWEEEVKQGQRERREPGLVLTPAPSPQWVIFPWAPSPMLKDGKV